MNLLEQYYAKKQDLSSQIVANSLPMDSLLVLQEINYRICVLETFKSFGQTAPITLEAKVLGYHYQLVDAFVGFLRIERKFGPKTDTEGEKKREMSAAALERVIQDNRKRFASFKANTQDQYKTSVNGLINTVLPMWVQYRNTYINI